MGTRGPSPQPRKLKLLLGTSEGRDSGGRRVRDDPKYIRQAPDKPEDLSPNASDLWDVVIADLEVMDVLKASDGPAIEMMCEAYATWKDSQGRIRKFGRLVKRPSGMAALSPLVRDQREAGIEYLRLAREFGLTASALQRLATDPLPADNDANPYGRNA